MADVVWRPLPGGMAEVVATCAQAGWPILVGPAPRQDLPNIVGPAPRQDLPNYGLCAATRPQVPPRSKSFSWAADKARSSDLDGDPLPGGLADLVGALKIAQSMGRQNQPKTATATRERQVKALDSQRSRTSP